MTGILGELGWLAIAIGLPTLAATLGAQRVTKARGIDAWRNPGGWRFPLGEVVTFASALAGILLVMLVAVAIT